MLKKYFQISIIILCIVAVSSLIMSVSGARDDTAKQINQEKVKIAVCPTFLSLASTLDQDEFEIIKTQSTSESLDLLNNKTVDYVLAGRPPKPHEKNYQTEFISKIGYSFVSKTEKAVTKDDLDKEKICSDLDEGKIDEGLHLKEVVQVNNILECPQESIVITSWDNTNYGEFWPVHVMNNDGLRHILSRTPIVYCKEACPLNIINQIKIAYEK